MHLVNRTFDELQPGDSAELRRLITPDDLYVFAAASGNYNPMHLPSTDLDGDGELDLAIFEGVESGLLDDEDLAAGAAIGAPGSAVGVLVYENTWAGPFVSAMHRAGAEVIASGRIPAAKVAEALDALEAADDSTDDDSTKEN